MSMNYGVSGYTIEIMFSWTYYYYLKKSYNVWYVIYVYDLHLYVSVYNMRTK